MAALNIHNGLTLLGQYQSVLVWHSYRMSMKPHKLTVYLLIKLLVILPVVAFYRGPLVFNVYIFVCICVCACVCVCVCVCVCARVCRWVSAVCSTVHYTQYISNQSVLHMPSHSNHSYWSGHLQQGPGWELLLQC